jgi:prophage antirepressor-like protein
MVYNWQRCRPRSPTRNRNVYFVGAGLSKALGLPNTAELLTGVLRLARRSKRWKDTERLPERIDNAFK